MSKLTKIGAQPGDQSSLLLRMTGTAPTYEIICCDFARTDTSAA